MKFGALLISICGLAFAAAAMAKEPAAQGAGADSLLIRNVYVVSPERDGPPRKASVYVENGRIAEISRRPSRKAKRAATVIDGKSRYLSPGLIDGHVHLGEIPGMISDQEAAYPEIAAEARAQIPLSYLYYGFTTLVDLNGRPGYIADWNATPVHPKAYFCGGAPVFDGYPTNYLPKPQRYEIVPYFLYDESRADEFPKNVDPAKHMPETVVEKMQEDGAICVKTHYEPGFGGRGHLPVPTVKLIQALVAAAHARGLPVLLHANSEEAQSFGLEAGVDAMAHGMWTWNDRDAAALNEDVTAVLDGVIENNVGYQPTVQVLYGERDLHDPHYVERPELKAVLPQSLIDWYLTDDGQWWRNRMMRSAYLQELLKKSGWREIDAAPIERVTEATAYLNAHGAKLLFGSDTPSDPTFANPPGLNGRLEIENWRKAGVSPEEIFRAATIRDAEFFGLDDEIGSVEEGKRADLLLLAKNPMKDTAAYDSVETVILGGRVIDRADLRADRER